MFVYTSCHTNTYFNTSSMAKYKNHLIQKVYIAPLRYIFLFDLLYILFFCFCCIKHLYCCFNCFFCYKNSVMISMKLK
ncbi:hypothetical protein XELAEV_18016876mg [Xenopus laevis]|uniref:Uncharacterized protein n=1 Tax=Xenopus laevis TaxID=8355 RepID=A0A974HSB1_XENLA|nr:hypothetical protein XELAEV_18016876mg [Xenopus laevis]